MGENIIHNVRKLSVSWQLSYWKNEPCVTALLSVHRNLHLTRGTA